MECGKWVCTDKDTIQYTKKIDDFSFDFIQAVEAADGEWVASACRIDLKDYTLDELWKYCRRYYTSYKQMVDSYGFREAIKVAAECVFKQLLPDEMEFNVEYDDFDSAVRFIERYMRQCDGV